MILANAHFVDSDISGTASGTGSWQSEQSTTATFYSVGFDNDSGTIAQGEAITNLTYDWVNDANCVSVWDFESLALIGTDDKGSETLTNTGATVSATAKHGDNSLAVSATKYLSRADADLVSGFPLKSTESNKTFTIMGWVRSTSVSTADMWFSKNIDFGGVNKRSLALGIRDFGGTIKFAMQTGNATGADWNIAETSIQCLPDTWYHVAFTYDESASRAWTSRIYTDGGASASDSGTMATDAFLSDAPIRIGHGDPDTAGQQWVGFIDQVIVFKDVLSDADIDLIRADTGNYLKSGICYAIDYTGDTITYQLDSGGTQFEDDDFMYNGTDVVQANGTPAEATNPLTQDRTVAFPQDRSHLEGQTVQVLDDGVVVTGQSITAGVLDPGGLTGTLHVGLGYTSELKPSKLDIEGMGLILTKKITKAIVSFYNTLKGKVGLNTDTMYDVAFGTDLFTGIKEVPYRGQYEREGDIVVQQTEPLPMTCRGIIFNAGVHTVK